MKLMFKSPREALHRRAFTLIEVMIAMGVFFIALFAILALTSQLLQNARRLQGKQVPHVSLVHAWYTSITNRVTEGVKDVEFSEISTDLGDLYRDFRAEIEAVPDPEMTNGLWDVTYRIINRRNGQTESEVLTLYWDPNTQSKSGVGIR